MSEAAQKWVYENSVGAIGMTQEEFLALLRKAKKDGYARDDQAFNAGLRCVAAPICGPGGKALYSISVSAPSLRMDDARYELVRQLVVRYSALATAESQEL